MRQIKFRAWDEIRKEFNFKVQVGNIDPKDENYTAGSILIDGQWKNFDEFSKITIEQFIGLLDKTGREAYEGDIVDIDDGDGWVVGRGRIVFNRGKFQVLCKDGPCDIDGRVETMIGNVHEHKHLLEGKHE